MATGMRVAEPVVIAESQAMRRVVTLARRLAETAAPVLLVGATGTGKEVLAQAIHAWSGRPGRFMDLDCGSIPTSMLANQLFGHVRGAYTGATEAARGLIERAERGTLFLDELTGLSARGQATLMRVLETGEVRRLGSVDKVRVDFRLIGAVQERLWEALRVGAFRSDLYQRLSGWLIHLPPLIERRDDIVPLAQYFAQLRSSRLATKAVGLLLRYSWPGNIRELRTVIDRATFFAAGGELSEAAIGEALEIGIMPRTSQRDVEESSGIEDDDGLMQMCEEVGWDLGEAARRLRIHRSTLYRRVRALGITRDKLTVARVRAQGRPAPPPSLGSLAASLES